MKYNLLVYGSLLSINSASSGLGRDVSAEDYIDVTIRDHCLDLNVKESVAIDSEHYEACFFNLSKCDGHVMNLKYITVDEDELSRLKKREKNYFLKDMTSFSDIPKGDSIYTFAGESCSLAGQDEKRIVLNEYILKVKNGAMGLSESLYNDIKCEIDRSLSQCELLYGDYRFVSDEQNKYTDSK